MKSFTYIFFKYFAWIFKSNFTIFKEFMNDFGANLGEHLTMAASANMFYGATDYKNKANMKVAAC